MDEFEFPKEEHIGELQKTVKEFFTENNLEMLLTWRVPIAKEYGYGDGDMLMFYMLQLNPPMARYQQIGVYDKSYLAIVLSMPKLKQNEYDKLGHQRNLSIFT